MAKLIFRLRGVPDDEAADVKELLEQHRFDFYETSAGNWGISMPAFWLNDESEFERAQTLINKYQERRSLTAREEWESSKKSRQHPTIFKSFRERPFASLGLILFCCVILYFSVKPFFNLLAAD